MNCLNWPWLVSRVYYSWQLRQFVFTILFSIHFLRYLEGSDPIGQNHFGYKTQHILVQYIMYTQYEPISKVLRQKKRFSFMYPWMLWVDEIVWEWEMKFSQSSSKWTQSAAGPFNKNSLWRHFWNSEYSFSYLCSHTLFVLIISLIFSILSIQFMFYWDLISILR